MASYSLHLGVWHRAKFLFCGEDANCKYHPVSTCSCCISSKKVVDFLPRQHEADSLWQTAFGGLSPDNVSRDPCALRATQASQAKIRRLSCFLAFTCFHCGLGTCSEMLLIGRAKFRISLRLEQKLPVGGPLAEALDGGRALLGPFARVKWRVKSDEPKGWSRCGSKRPMCGFLL